jgi:hypothetical protein
MKMKTEAKDGCEMCFACKTRMFLLGIKAVTDAMANIPEPPAALKRDQIVPALRLMLLRVGAEIAGVTLGDESGATQPPASA